MKRLGQRSLNGLEQACRGAHGAHTDSCSLAATRTPWGPFKGRVAEFGGYIRANATSIPNYGERFRAGETTSSAFVESAVNQVVSKRMVKKPADALDAAWRSPAPASTYARPE